MEEIKNTLHRIVQNLFSLQFKPECEQTDEQFGDYATNVALQLAGKVGKPPRVVAEQIVAALKAEPAHGIKDITIAGPGFINITLSDAALVARVAGAATTKPSTYKNKVVVADYPIPTI
jgi:arginyl-tRNA synthetase